MALTLPPLLILATLAWIDWRGRLRWKLSSAALWWSLGALLFALFVMIQIVPLPPVVGRAISGESHEIWIGATDILNTIDRDLVPAWHPLSIDPRDSARGLIGILARLALLIVGVLLFRSERARVVLAVTLTAAAAFQIIYGIGHWSGSLVEIWGRDNLTYGRMSGTFVNPNHLGHYLTMILPITLYLVAHAWYRTRHEKSLGQRVERTLFRHPAVLLIGGIGGMVGVFGILLTKSRGALLSLLVAFLIGLVLHFEETSARRRRTVRAFRRRAVWTSIVLILVIGISIIHLGTERITERMIPDREGIFTLAGRVEGGRLAVEIWKMFPLVGSGWESFDAVSLIVSDDPYLHHSHVHNDYLEVLATTGIVGSGIVLLFLLLGMRGLARQLWPAMLGRRFDPSASGDWRRFAGMGAISIFVTLLHALVEFNFYIPANSYTFALIVGATVTLPVKKSHP